MHACEIQPLPPSYMVVCEVWFNTHITKVAWDSPIHGFCVGESPIHKSLLGSIASHYCIRMCGCPLNGNATSPFDQLSNTYLIVTLPLPLLPHHHLVLLIIFHDLTHRREYLSRVPPFEVSRPWLCGHCQQLCFCH